MFTKIDSDLKAQALGLVEGEPNLIANLANLSALFFHEIPNLNWAGFYLWDEQTQELVLGPFQGKPACVRISPKRGVCGLAYSRKTAQRVDDVHLFPGHIACDSDSQSELVIPIMVGQSCLGVLDLDSPLKARFSQSDLDNLQDILESLIPKLWN
jgi:L-methionine (R)-S-oxide reductase